MQRLGINKGKYFGESIAIDEVLRQIQLSGEEHGWQREVFLKADAYELIALTRKVERPTKRIYLSTGIHGDEPAGPLAVLELIRENYWPAELEVWLCPCLNPTGFRQNRRENNQGLDLNRQYLNPDAEEIRAHITWLDNQPTFDVALCLHEDWESSGFYLYELNPDEQTSFASNIISRVSPVCPIDLSMTIEGRPSVNGIIRPSVEPASRPQWPESFYLLTNNTRLSYTVEAPSDFSLSTRVASLVAAVRAVTDQMPV